MEKDHDENKTDIRSGWRYFQCDECHCRWSEKCRDHSTLSNSHCIDCGEPTMPYDSTPVAFPTDGYGNLID